MFKIELILFKRNMAVYIKLNVESHLLTHVNPYSFELQSNEPEIFSFHRSITHITCLKNLYTTIVQVYNM
jgi:hypothetical protein